MNGLELIKHTAGGGVMTATTTGGSVKLLKNGKIDFTNVTKVHVDKCFDVPVNPGDEPLYDNYLIIYRAKGNVRESGQGFRLRASGEDNMDMNYVRQYLEANDGNVNGRRQGPGSNWSNLTYASFSTAYSGTALYLYGPSLAQPTAVRSVHMAALDGAYILDSAATHSAGTRFDGFTINTTNDSITGALTIYGFTKGTTP